MRAATLLALAALGASLPARADECGTLIARVAAETGAAVERQSTDYASFTAGPDTTLTLACGAPALSSVGAQFRGASPPETYYDLFAKAGHAVTGIDTAVIAEAAHRAQATATRMRHSNVDLGGARVTCSAMNAPDKGPLTLCAVIEHSDRS
ncbi:ABC transporter ATPase [Methylobacterium sp. NEAU 140]|uniref:ABC transporter ATPase n=1 Tax=Methylobacterium sp. NEAU 140 TaxID=3064945 RepID=UPI0027375A7E|nr:ABC transporter ATPase [Methylobacterium sp. NEAU 140]MDP4024991.1 ABC transporter ATPase [Methylobacterium sp. NEAU 140]